MVAKLEDTIYLLYQNRVREAIEMVAEWLTVFQNLLGDCECVKNPEIRKFGVFMMRELLDAYQAYDVIAMADCMTEKSVLFMKVYFRDMSVEESEG
ncbi:MAG: hypothetical protein ACLT3H_13525 [Roseburia sp.]